MTKPISAFLLLAILTAIATPAFAQANCPLINGKFFMEGTRDGKPRRFTFTLFTRVAGDTYFYSVAKDTKEYQAADGVTRSVKIGNELMKMTIRCSGENTFEREIVYEDTGERTWVKITPMGDDYIEVKANNKEFNGIFERDRR